MPKKPNDKKQRPNFSPAAPNSVEPEKQTEPTAPEETVHDIFMRKIAGNPRFVKAKNTGRAYEFFGEHIYQQAKASAVNAWEMGLRPGEPPLGSLSLVEQKWLVNAIECLIQVDEYRKSETVNESGHCVFEVGPAYIQCRAPNYAKHIICEAVSGKLVPEIRAILTPEKNDRLLREFGFIGPGRSPNFAQKIGIKSRADLAYTGRLAYRVFRDIYEVKDFGAAKFKVWPPKSVALSVSESEKPTTKKFILTIEKQPLVMELEAILNLFGKARTIEFADEKWTPFVSIELEAPPTAMPTVQHIDFTNMTEAETIDALKALPKDVADFPGFVRKEIEKIEKAQSLKK